jgi:hypothetical protein
MLSLDDPRWQQLYGGYRIPFDPRPLLIKIERDPSPKNWGLLTEELFHQGDVGDASYAAVPQIVRITLKHSPLHVEALTLVVLIEVARRSRGNPRVPEWLEAEYETAIEQLARETLIRFEQLESTDLVRGALGILAVWKGQTGCARAAALHSEEELQEILY